MKEYLKNIREVVENNRSDKDDWNKNMLEKWKLLSPKQQMDLLPNIVPFMHATVFGYEDIEEQLKRVDELLEVTPDEVKEKCIEDITKKYFGSYFEHIPATFIGSLFIPKIMSKCNLDMQEKAMQVIISNISKFEKRDNDLEDSISPQVELLLGLSKYVNKSILEKRRYLYETSFFKKELEGILNEDKICDIDLLSDYIKYELERDRYATTNNRIVSQIQQIVTNEKSAHNLKSWLDKIKPLYQDLKETESEPEIGKYEEVKDFSNMSDEKFLEFISDLKKYRNIHGIFPEECCDYLLKQALEKDSTLTKGGYRKSDDYKELMSRVFEDKCRYILKEKDIENYFVSVTETLDKNTCGLQNSYYKTIQINKKIVDSFNSSKYIALNTIYHESRHAEQRRDIESGKLPIRYEYKMLKEAIIRRKNPEFYDENYKYMINEVDARIAGSRDCVKFLKKIGISNKRIAEKLGMDVLENFKYDMLDEVDRLDTKRFKKTILGRRQHMNDYFCKLVAENPEIIEKYPTLEIEFNKDGSRKPSIQILQEYEKATKEIIEEKTKTKSVENKARLYPEIFNDRFSGRGKIIIEDINLLVDYEPMNEAMKKIRDKIIREEILPEIEIAKTCDGFFLEKRRNRRTKTK